MSDRAIILISFLIGYFGIYQFIMVCRGSGNFQALFGGWVYFAVVFLIMASVPLGIIAYHEPKPQYWLYSVGCMAGGIGLAILFKNNSITDEK